MILGFIFGDAIDVGAQILQGPSPILIAFFPATSPAGDVASRKGLLDVLLIDPVVM